MALKVYKSNNFATLESDPGSTFTVPLQSAYIAAEDGTLNSIGRIKIIANESATAPDGNVYLSAYPWYSIKDRTGATAATGPASTVTYLNEIFDDPIEITDFVKPDTSSGKSETTQFVHNGDISAGGALILDTDGAKIGFQDNTYLNIEEDNTYGAGYGTLTINLENNGSTQNFLTAQMGNVYSQAVTTINVGTLQINGDTSFTSDVELGNGISDTITVNGTLVGVNIPDMDDVTVTAVADKQILEYDSATSQWVNVYLDHSYVRVYNNSGAAMSKGDVVYISGAQNANVAQISLAQANSSSTMPAIGVLYEDLTNGAEGLAVISGKANGVALPSASFSEGDVVYVSATTAGGVTATKPTGTNLIQNLGIVMNTHDTNGTIKVTGVGRTNDVPNIPNGQAWIGNASGVATPTALATVATSGDYNDLTNTPSGGTQQTLDGIYLEVVTRSSAYGAAAFEGQVVKFGTGTLSAGKVYVLRDNGGAALWDEADADAEIQTKGLLGMALGTSPTTDGLLVRGMRSYSNSFTVGAPLYISLTAGTLTDDLSSHTTGDFVRAVGYSLSTTLIYLDPSPDYIELA
jgi:hypothetical protein